MGETMSKAMSETMSSMMDMSCTQFSDELAAKVSVPGGGAAAAYVGALSAALGAMAGNFTVGKERYAQYEDDLQHMLVELGTAREHLLKLVEEDAKAFEPLSQAYAIPKDDPLRAETLERCSKAAIEAPLEMMRQTAHVVEVLEEMNEKCTRLLVSDVACAAACATAALKAASVNVFVNTKALTDREYAVEIDNQADELLEFTMRSEAVFDNILVDLCS